MNILPEKIYEPKFIDWFSPYVIDFIIDNAPKTKTNIIIVPHASYNYTKNVIGEIYSRIDFMNIHKIILLCTALKNIIKSNIYTKNNYNL